MPMRDLLATFFQEHPECSLRALGAGGNAAALDLCPFGQAIEYLDAARHPRWVERYHAANRVRFPDPLGLPGWVLTDLYLMPAAIGLLTCPARYLDTRPPGLDDADEAIAAAYYAAPSIVPHTAFGVSLLSLREGIGGAALIKAMTLAMLRARTQRGIAQFDNRSLRVHTRLGPLRLLGPVPRAHDKAETSFLYEVDVAEEANLATAMCRPKGIEPVASPEARWVPVEDRASLFALLEEAERGANVFILPPGLSKDGRSVLVRHGG